jgi:hypothetical protein
MATPWNDIGVAGMVYTAAWLEHTVGMEVVSIGRSAQNATTKEDCVLELDGSQLFIRIAIRSGWIWLYGCGQDEPSDQLQFLFNPGDGPQRVDDHAKIRSSFGAIRNQVAPLKTDSTRRSWFSGCVRNRVSRARRAVGTRRVE